MSKQIMLWFRTIRELYIKKMIALTQGKQNFVSQLKDVCYIRREQISFVKKKSPPPQYSRGQEGDM